MKRRNFLLIGISGATAIGVPWYLIRKSSLSAARKISHPGFLSQVCDENELAAIGANYLNQFPASAGELSSLILSGRSGPSMTSESEAAALMSFLDMKILDDFTNGRTVVANGWVLSETEARQCAAFSLTR